MKTLEQQVQEIVDREEIKELTAKYAHWVALGICANLRKVVSKEKIHLQGSAADRFAQVV